MNLEFEEVKIRRKGPARVEARRGQRKVIMHNETNNIVAEGDQSP